LLSIVDLTVLRCQELAIEGSDIVLTDIYFCIGDLLIKCFEFVSYQSSLKSCICLTIGTYLDRYHYYDRSILKLGRWLVDVILKKDDTLGLKS